MTKNEFERLQPGDLLQNKKDNKWAFIVHQNFGDRITVVRTMEIRDPENWDKIVTQEEPTEAVPFHEKPEIKEAASAIHKQLTGNDWYQMVGIGANQFVVYTAKKKHPKPITEFGGLPVIYRYMGKIAPLGPT